MEEKTTIKVSKTTVNLLKLLSKQRGRNESMEQVLLGLIDVYIEVKNEK